MDRHTFFFPRCVVAGAAPVADALEPPTVYKYIYSVYKYVYDIWYVCVL